MTNLEKIIYEKGPLLSSELIDVVSNENNKLKNTTIRKRLTRLDDDIYKIKGLFVDNQALFYHRDIHGTTEYYSGLKRALKKAGKQYNIVLNSLDFHNGYLKSNQLASYSISPIQKLKGHVLFDSVILKLKNLHLIYEEGENTVLAKNISENDHELRRSKGIDVGKNFILIQFNDWSRKLGLVSYNSSRFQGEFGKFQFNFVAPSYIGSLTKKSGDKIIPAFVIADILIGNPINESQVEFFINKINVLKTQKKLSPFLPFLIVDSVDPKALNKLKSHGVVIGFTNELFGDTYKDLLNSLINLVTNAGAILKKNPDAYLDLISKLNKLVSGKTNNLRGDLFELAVGYYHGRFSKNIDIGKIITQDGIQREIDVFSYYPNKIVVSECKGYNSPIEKNDIDKWLGEKIPVIRKWILNQPSISDFQVIFEFWSTGGFTPEAKELINNRKESTKKYIINTFELDEMIELSKSTKTKKFTEILQEYYVKDLS